MPLQSSSGAAFAAVVWGGGDAHAAEFVGVIFAIEHVPLFAAFENFLLLRRDALADFGVRFLFLFQRGGENLHDLLANGVTILDKFHFVAGDEHIGNLVRQANYFFPREFHERFSTLANGAAFPNSIGKRSMGKGGFCDALTAAPACGRAPIALSPFCTSPGRRR